MLSSPPHLWMADFALSALDLNSQMWTALLVCLGALIGYVCRWHLKRRKRRRISKMHTMTDRLDSTSNKQELFLYVAWVTHWFHENVSLLNYACSLVMNLKSDPLTSWLFLYSHYSKMLLSCYAVDPQWLKLRYVASKAIVGNIWC